VSKAPFDKLGVPFHSRYQSDLTPISAGEPVELAFSLLPTSYRFHRGTSIRIMAVCADADNFDTPLITAGAKLHLLGGMHHSSFV
jgi:hypothetical protein